MLLAAAHVRASITRRLPLNAPTPLPWTSFLKATSSDHPTRYLLLHNRVFQTTSPACSFSPSSNSSKYPVSLLQHHRPRLRPKVSSMAHSHQHRDHGGHSHGHGHSHDNSYLISANSDDPGVRITRIGLYVNLGMAISKGLGGYYFNSKALTADAIHSLTDLVSDFMTLATVSFSLKPASERFPNGYGKVEPLGSLGVSGILLVGGFMMGWSAVLSLAGQLIPGFEGLVESLGLMHGHGHGHDHSHTDLGPNINAIWLAAGSIAIKEWLYRATLKVAKAKKSSVLASNAYHHRVDSLTAFVALLMIAGSNVLENASWMDPVGGLIISLMVVQAGLGNTKSAILELLDGTADDDVKAKVRKNAERAISNAGGKISKDVEVRQVEGRKAGQNYFMDVELVVPDAWPLSDLRLVEHEVRTRIGEKVRGVKRVKVRFVPQGDSAQDEFIGADVSPRSSPEPESDEEHKHDHDHPHTR